MKRLLFVLMIMLSMGIAKADNSAALWKKVAQADNDGKPQTAVGYLDKLEKLAQGDTLELYYIAEKKYDELRKYNWKEANNYDSRTKYPLYRAVFGNLDESIKKYEGHRREIILLYERLIRNKQAVDSNYKGKTGADYERIKKECQQLLKKHPKTEYTSRIKSIIENMDEVVVSVYSKGQIAPSANVTFEVNLKNVPILSVAVYRLNDNVWYSPQYAVESSDKSAALKQHGTLVWSSRCSDIKNEYNIYEEVKMAVPLTEEGIYVISFNYGSARAYVRAYVSRTVAAIRELNGNAQIYAADIESGKPLDSYNVSLIKSFYDYDKNGFGRVKPLETKAVVQDGFTDLPYKRDLEMQVRAEAGGSLASPAISIYGSNNYYYHGVSDMAKYRLFTDKTLYGPGDTVWFKVIKYSLKGEGLSGEVVANSPVTVELKYERENAPTGKCALTTNDMGSASGFFTLPEGSKNGRYILYADGMYMNSVRIEEYIRPDFELSLNPVKDIYCFNDVAKQSGVFKSFAGYNVSGAKVEYEVFTDSASGFDGQWYYVPRTKMAEGSTVTDADGRFEVAFTAVRPKYRDEEKQVVTYEVKIKVTDPQGETHEKTSCLRVSDYPLDLNVKMDMERLRCVGTDTTLATTAVVNKSVAADFTPEVTNLAWVPQTYSGKYVLECEGKVMQEGAFSSGEKTVCDFSKLPSGLYKMTFSVVYRGRTIQNTISFYLVGEEDVRIPLGADFFFFPLHGGKNIRFLAGTSRDDLYLEMELFADAARYMREPLHLSREMRLIEIPYEERFGTCVSLSLFGICRGHVVEQKESYTWPEEHGINVEIATLRDKTKPDTDETMTVKAPSGTELLVSIYDVTSERYGKNNYGFNPLSSVINAGSPAVRTTLNDWGDIRVRGVSRKAAPAGNAVNSAAMDVVEEEAIPFALADNASMGAAASGAEKDESAEAAAEAPELRSDKSELIAFRPHVLVPESGEAVVNFRTGGLLSTFKVNVMGHMKNLYSGCDSKTFIVQKDVMVKPSLPLFAREGDKITLRGKVVNLSAEALSGSGSVEFFDDDSGKPLKIAGVAPVKLALAAGQQGEIAWDITVPSTVKKLGVKMWYRSGQWSDGEQNVIAVEPAKIVLTEAASFVMGGPHGHKYYEKELRKKFPVANPKIEYAEYSTLDAVKESLPAQFEPKHDNMIEWLNAYYINQMHIKVVDPAAAGGDFEHLLKFQNGDGGFCWFTRMNSSETLTLLFLERMAQLRDFGAIEMGAAQLAAVRKAVTFMDSRIKEGYASIGTCCIRSRWMSEMFGERAGEIFKEKLSDTEKGWQDFTILEKANLILTLQNCRGTSYWKDSYDKRIKQLSESLADYAVENPTIGVYFPNAVMPYRGLMNSEIYAHARLIDVFSRLGNKKKVDGIAQWLLLQKHNQAWENTVATTDAVHALLSSGAKDLKLGAVYYTYETALDKVKESANEITVKRTYMRPDGTLIAEGEELKVGDAIRVRYDIDNSENRSFVRLRAMRPADFYPKDERSYYSWSGYYREVKPSETNFFYELLPEGRSVIEETFFVTQSGRFTAGIGTIECLYATEYRGHTASRTFISK